MKKNIGNSMALYPTPAVVVGAQVEGKATWTLVAHVGIVAHDRLLVSLHASHYINRGIKESGRLSVNIVTEEWLPKADYCGIVSGHKQDKSTLFESTAGEEGTPMVNESPLTMECRVEDVYSKTLFAASPTPMPMRAYSTTGIKSTTTGSNRCCSSFLPISICARAVS